MSHTSLFYGCHFPTSPFELYIDFTNNIFKSVRFRIFGMIFHILIHIIPCNNQRCEVKIFMLFYFPPSAIAACAAASLAIGTLNGEHDT